MNFIPIWKPLMSDHTNCMFYFSYQHISRNFRLLHYNCTTIQLYNSPSIHQSHGNIEDTQVVQEEWVLQSKKVKLVDTKSGPFSTLTESLDVKCDSPLGIRGKKSVLPTKTLQDMIHIRVLPT